MMSVGTPLSPSWDTVLSVSPMSAYRGTDKEPENQGLRCLLCVYVCVSMCMSLCVRRLQMYVCIGGGLSLKQ